MFKLEKISLGYVENKKEFPAGLVMFTDTDEMQYLADEIDRVETAYGKSTCWYVRITDESGNVIFTTSNAPK